MSLLRDGAVYDYMHTDCMCATCVYATRGVCHVTVMNTGQVQHSTRMLS